MTHIERVVIVGAGPAGANAAVTLREQGYDGAIALIGAEPHLPYRRPPLSKGFLRGESPETKLPLKPQSEYDDLRIDRELGRRVTSIDQATGTVGLDDGRSLPFDRLLLATGSVPRRPTVPGSDREGVHTLRKRDDAIAIAASVRAGEPAVVLGGGWIGAEVAASLTQMGANVTLITANGLPLEHHLGHEVAEVISRVHRGNGVTLARGRVTRIDGSDRVERVVLEDGTRLPATLVVAGLGAAPDLTLATAAGLSLSHGGVAADEQLRTDDPRIFVAGDIAAARHPAYGRVVRVEHWDNAVQQGKHAARSMLGATGMYVRRPFFYSDQFDLGLEYRGLAHDPNDVVISGNPDSGSFSAFWLDRGRITAGMVVNDNEASERLGPIVESEPVVDRERLRREGARLELEAVAA
jgi:3-phenylpropionate/trans-cinnamate dioxygenase ferredoxin reductase subunit